MLLVYPQLKISGYYQPNPAREYTEESPGGDHDYLSRLVTDWEAAGNLPDSLNVRRVIVRSGSLLNIIIFFFFNITHLSNMVSTLDPNNSVIKKLWCSCFAVP